MHDANDADLLRARREAEYQSAVSLSIALGNWRCEICQACCPEETKAGIVAMVRVAVPQAPDAHLAVTESREPKR
jgi:hypothetical protein